MSWNHRVLAYKTNNGVYLQIHEVYYNKKGVPSYYSEEPITVGDDDLDGLSFVLSEMIKCISKPILWHGDDFPNEYKN